MKSKCNAKEGNVRRTVVYLTAQRGYASPMFTTINIVRLVMRQSLFVAVKSGTTISGFNFTITRSLFCSHIA